MKPEKRREQILRAATTVFAVKGYHRASVTDIIEGADIARGTFYLYFEGKREIFAELVDVLTVRLINCMRLVDPASGEPWQDQLRANIVRIASILLEERELTTILYNHAMGLDEDFDRKIREFYGTLTARTEAAFKLGQKMGLLRKDIHPRIAALNVVGGVKEVMYHAAAGELDMSAEEVVDEIFSHYTIGVLAAGAAKSKKPAGKAGKKK